MPRLSLEAREAGQWQRASSVPLGGGFTPQFHNIAQRTREQEEILNAGFRELRKKRKGAAQEYITRIKRAKGRIRLAQQFLAAGTHERVAHSGTKMGYRECDPWPFDSTRQSGQARKKVASMARVGYS